MAQAAVQIREENPDSWWLTTENDLRQALMMANGVKVVNGVNFYPDFEKWELIDPEHKFEDEINRYAHSLRFPDSGWRSGNCQPFGRRSIR